MRGVRAPLQVAAVAAAKGAELRTGSEVRGQRRARPPGAEPGAGKKFGGEGAGCEGVGGVGGRHEQKQQKSN